MLEVAYIIVAIALVVFLVYLIITLQKVGHERDLSDLTKKSPEGKSTKTGRWSIK